MSTETISRRGGEACWRDKPFITAFTLAVLTKIVVVWAFHTPLLGEYWRMVMFADAILSGEGWWHGDDIRALAIPPTLWKPIGYPLLIAGAKLLFAGGWSLALMVLQSLFSLAAGCTLYGLARDMRLAPIWAAAVFLLYEWSLPVSTDVLIMADGLVGSIGTLLFVAMGKQVLQGNAPRLSQALAWGGMLLIMFLLREIFEYALLFYLLALIALFYRFGKRSLLICAISLALPMVFADLSLRSWNLARAGAFTVTTGLQTAAVMGFMKVAERNPAVLAGDGLLEQVARQGPDVSAVADRYHHCEVFIDLRRPILYDYGDAQRINCDLFAIHGLTAPEIAGMARAKLLRTMVDFPVDYAVTVLQRLRLVQQGTLLGGPLTRLDDLHWWQNSGNEYYQGWRAEVRDFVQSRGQTALGPEAAMQFALRLVTRGLGTVLLFAFLLSVPVVALGRGLADPHVRLILAGWILYGGLLSLHLTVNFELRYLSAVNAVPLLGSLYLLNDWSRRFLGWRHARAEESGTRR